MIGVEVVHENAIAHLFCGGFRSAHDKCGERRLLRHADADVDDEADDVRNNFV